MEYHIECQDKDYDLYLTEYKEIPLTQEKVALVDVEDYEWLNQFKWFAVKKENTFYAGRYSERKKEPKRKRIHIHREIMQCPKGKQIDHKNQNGLDNRQSNLRTCNRTQNNANISKYKNNTSGYKGIYWDKRISRWTVALLINYKRKYLGYFKTKEEAALAYNKGAIKYFGEFACLNVVTGD